MKTRKNINTTLDIELYKNIKMLAIQKGVNANNLIEQGMEIIISREKSINKDQKSRTLERR